MPSAVLYDRLLVALAIATSCLTCAAYGQVPPVAGNPRQVDFTRDVQPLLKQRCGACHGGDKRESGLRLDVRADALRGGDSGKVILPGNSGESPLILRVASDDPDERMPPKGEPLSAEQIALLKQSKAATSASPTSPATSSPACSSSFRASRGVMALPAGEFSGMKNQRSPTVSRVCSCQATSHRDNPDKLGGIGLFRSTHSPPWPPSITCSRKAA